MAVYRIGRRTTNVTSGEVSMDVATSTGLRPRLMQWSIAMGAATASIYRLNRPTAIGTRTTPTALIAEDPDDPALTGITLTDSALAHSVQPTLASVDLDRVALPATIGAGWIFTFPKGLIIDVSMSICLVNGGSNGVIDSTPVVDQ